uniref:Muscle, skeletal receptor tyrosine protein kinase n=1 Tax=Magallana gigas TaxID=29159 RepID=K1PFN5_MAGGI
MTAANPNTSIIWRWYRTDRPNVVLFYGPNYTLPNIQRNMSGTYNCTASNSIGTSEANIINVEVQYRPEVISNTPSPYRVIEGHECTLVCAVNAANPGTNISWKWTKLESPNYTLHNGSTYTISNVQRYKSGLYKCTASNSVGTSVGVTIYLDVLCKYSFLKRYAEKL